MVNNKLSEWFKEGTKKGYSVSELKKLALKKGYSEKEIEMVFSDAMPKKKTFLILILLISLAALAVFIFYTFRTPAAPPCPDQEYLCNAFFNETQDCANESGCMLLQGMGKATRMNSADGCGGLEGLEKQFCMQYSIKNMSYCVNFGMTCSFIFSDNENCTMIMDGFSKNMCIISSSKNKKECISSLQC